MSPSKLSTNAFATIAAGEAEILLHPKRRWNGFSGEILQRVGFDSTEHLLNLLRGRPNVSPGELGAPSAWVTSVRFSGIKITDHSGPILQRGASALMRG